MKIKNLKIKFFRGIHDLTLDFGTDQPIVFIGSNGVGKSTILECLAVFLSRLMMAVRTPRGVLPPTLTEKDITNGYNETINETTISVDQLGDLPLSFVLDRATFTEDSQGESDELNVFRNFVYGQFKANPKASLPLAVYYPTNRTVYGSIPLENIKEDFLVQINAYDGAIVAGKTDFTDFFMWFKKVEDLENELRLDNNPDYRNRKLEAVRQAIYSLIPEFSNLRVRRYPLRMTVTKQGEECTVNQLSDGEKCLLAMVGDLARRLAIANPGLSNPLEGEGVVLIDEIELHLHPKWQREIIPALTRTFPNCQFIVTTHSPQVISHVKPEGIYILEATTEGIIAKKPESSFGRDSNQILEDIMGVPDRPQQIKDSLRQLFQLIDAGNLEAAKELRHQLADEIGYDEPEFVRADILIQRKEIFNR